MPVEATILSFALKPVNLKPAFSTPTISIRPEPVAKIVADKFSTTLRRRQRPAAKAPNEVSKLNSAPTRKIARLSAN